MASSKVDNEKELSKVDNPKELSKFDNPKESFWSKLKKVNNIIFVLLALAILVMICIAAATYDSVDLLTEPQSPKSRKQSTNETETFEETQNRTDRECQNKTTGVLFGCPTLRYGMLITLDNGPTTNTEKILKTLRLANITALFFLTSWNMYLYPNMVREIERAGHEIGFLLNDKYRCAQQIKEAEIVHKNVTLRNVGDGRVRVVRFNSGSMDATAADAANGAGYKVVLWNAATHRIDVDPIYDVKVAQSSLAYIPENGAILSLSETSKITILLLENIWNEMRYGFDPSKRYLAGPFLTPDDCFNE